LNRNQVTTIWFADMQGATAALIEAALTERWPRSSPAQGLPDTLAGMWRRGSQETLVSVKRQGWRHPLALSSCGWWGRLPPMDDFRRVLTWYPDLNIRVDSLIGFDFCKTDPYSESPQPGQSSATHGDRPAPQPAAVRFSEGTTVPVAASAPRSDGGRLPA
jgi:hypothetical protein